MSTITDGLTIFTPRLVLGYEVAVEGRNIVHELIGNPTPDVTLREAGLRTGRLRILCDDEPHAAACLALHRRAAPLTLTNTDLPGASMTYVLAPGGARITLDENTLVRCIVEAEFQEVTP